MGTIDGCSREAVEICSSVQSHAQRVVCSKSLNTASNSSSKSKVPGLSHARARTPSPHGEAAARLRL